MRQSIFISMLLLVANTCIAENVPVYIIRSMQVGNHYRVIGQPNPRKGWLDFSAINANEYNWDHCMLRGCARNETTFQANIQGWNIKPVTIYAPIYDNGMEYESIYIGYYKIDFQLPNKSSVIYSCSLGGSADETYPDRHPNLWWTANIGYGASERFGMIPIYKTGDSRLLGHSKILTVSSDGCYWNSLRTIILWYYGSDSHKFKNLSNMEWCKGFEYVDNKKVYNSKHDIFGSKSGAGLLSHVAAKALDMKYFTKSATRKSIEYLHARGWPPIIYLTGHFMACAPGIAIKSNGGIIWDLVIDNNKNREDVYERRPDGRLRVFSGTKIPRFNVHPSYKKRVKNLRCFVPNDKIYKTTRLGVLDWYRQKKYWWKAGGIDTSAPSYSTTSSAKKTYSPVSAGESSIPSTTQQDKLCFSSIEMSVEGPVITQVDTPSGTVNNPEYDGCGNEMYLYSGSNRTDDVWPLPEGGEVLLSEFGAPNSAPSGQYVVHLSGKPGEESILNVIETDANNVETTFEEVSITIPETGQLTVAIDHQPGLLDIPDVVSSCSELGKLELGTRIYVKLPVSLVYDGGFYIQDLRGLGIFVQWTGLSSTTYGRVATVEGTLIQKRPELIVQADKAYSWFDNKWITPVMPNNWWYAAPFCQLSKIIGVIQVNDDVVTISNGRQSLTVKNLPLQQAQDWQGRRLTLLGIIRADRTFAYIGDDWYQKSYQEIN